MYNSQRKNSAAWWVMEEFIKPLEDLEAAAENAASEIECIEDERDQLQEDVDDLEKKLEEGEATLEVLQADKSEFIDLLSQTLLIGERLADFSRNRLVKMGALNESTDSDSSSGNNSDDSGQNTADQSDGKASAEGITRPQFP